ncbi:MAG: DNA translocase FtsK 4TM domain-containing protein [Deltaproteobacteria bacterium]|nr:DNA translocase FtsK 4TM domain-containing protein [Deltaproteobacteria bacterium]
MSITTAPRTFASSLGALVAGRRREFAILAGLMLGAFALVSLAGARVSDPTLFTPGSGRVENPCGPVGAHLAYMLYAMVGGGAWAIAVPMVAGVLALAGRKALSTGQWAAASGMYLTLLALAHLALGPGDPFYPGGLLGAGTAGLLTAGLGTVGAVIALLTAGLITATVLARIQWGEVARWGVDLLEAWSPRVLAWVLEAAHRVLAFLARLVRGLAWALAASIRAVATRVGRAVRRMGHSLTRGIEDVSDPWEEIEGLRDGDTVVGSVPALVEVEWDPTEVLEEDTSDNDVLGLFPHFSPRQSRLPLPPADPTDPPSPTGLRDEQGQGDDSVAVHRSAFLDEPQARDDGRALGRPSQHELPPLSLLDEVPVQHASFDEIELRRLAGVVEEKLDSFKIGGRVTAVQPGPVVTTFEFEPEPGIKVSRIASLSDDLAMALKALRVRIVAPIPGKGCVGIEIPSERRLTIFLREILAASEFRENKRELPCILGKDVVGRPVVADLARMPHLLIGGTTGSGKSVGVNGMLMSLLFTNTPEDLRLLLIDPKMLEFELYDGIPHLLHPVVTDAKGAAAALHWACREMDRRYSVLARWGTRNVRSYNRKVAREVKDWNAAKARQYMGDDWMAGLDLPWPEHIPYIVIVIDELADLMIVASRDVEESIVRLAQKARASGIHLLVATQRPSVDVITGLIKANLPTRISFQLRTRVDSRTVLDQGGAEALLGRGDMLYLPPGVGALQRCHGAFVSDEEVARVTAFLCAQASPEYIEDITGGSDVDMDLLDEERDELYDAALQIVFQAGKASTSMIQRHLKIGYNRAARIIDLMEASGVIGPADGARAREVLVSSAQEA